MYKSPSYFPYLEEQKGTGVIIQGEVNERFLEKMDIFERAPALYKRGKIEVQFKNVVLECTCYFKAENSIIDKLLHKNLISEWIE